MSVKIPPSQLSSTPYENIIDDKVKDEEWEFKIMNPLYKHKPTEIVDNNKAKNNVQLAIEQRARNIPNYRYFFD